jgi:tetratricopeptide (TPR) repeat protein
MAMEIGSAAKEFLDKGDVEAAKSKATDALEKLKEKSDSIEGVSMIATTFTSASMALGTMEEAIKTASEMESVFSKSNNVVGQASMMLSAAELNSALGGGDLQSSQMQALKMANKELEAARTSGNKKLEVELLEVVTHAHGLMEESYGAFQAAKKAAEIYTAMGNMSSLGEMQFVMATQQKRLGDNSEATKLAEAASKSFRQAKSKGGQDKALALISAIFVERGQPEKAPTRSEALKCLASLSKATEMRKVDEAKDLEQQLNNFGSVLSDQDLAETLQPLFAKDPEAMEFLQKELGWDFGAGTKGGPGEQIHFYPQKAFYLSTIMGGMGFGPQFRAVNPHRVGRLSAISATQLPETEAWQMELGFRPGVWDSGLQVLAATSFP